MSTSGPEATPTVAPSPRLGLPWASARRVALTLALGLAAAPALLAQARPAASRRPDEATQPARTPAPPRRAPKPWTQVKSWIYQLQEINLRALAEAGPDLVVIDYAKHGDDASAFSHRQIQALRARGIRVVCYLSIGEAEPYRFYWQSSWNPGITPRWLLPPNPHWPDNFPVEYWNQDWQQILFRGPNSYLSKILDAGFDGIYLDIVDGYERFARKRPQAAQEMKDLIRDIAQVARERAGEDFGIFSQNALDLLEDPSYRAILTGLGKEETYFFPEDERNPPGDMRWEEDQLRRLVSEGKLVLTVDYPSKESNRVWTARRALAQGFVPYLADTELDRIWPLPDLGR